MSLPSCDDIAKLPVFLGDVIAPTPHAPGLGWLHGHVKWMAELIECDKIVTSAAEDIDRYIKNREQVKQAFEHRGADRMKEAIGRKTEDHTFDRNSAEPAEGRIETSSRCVR